MWITHCTLTYRTGHSAQECSGATPQLQHNGYSVGWTRNSKRTSYGRWEIRTVFHFLSLSSMEKNNIKMNFRDIRFEGLNWIHLDQGRNQWQFLVSSRSHWNVWNFLTARGATGFTRGTVLHVGGSCSHHLHISDFTAVIEIMTLQ